jgi:hypothetical protein
MGHCFGGLEVDDQLDLGGLLNRQAGGLVALRIRPASGVRPHLWLAEHRIRSELWAPFCLHRPRVVCAALGPT